MATLKATTVNGTLSLANSAGNAILIPASASYSNTSQPTALSYGRLQCYGTLNINADTDNSGTEYVILTSGKGASSSTADGLAVGQNSLTWKDEALATQNYVSNYVLTRPDVRQYSIKVDGDSDKFYPVVIGTTYNKDHIYHVSVYRNLGGVSASYEGNHSNGTSSLWALYEHRYTGWDGNGGYGRTHYVTQPYARLLENAQFFSGSYSGLVVWLRGGGTTYEITTEFDTTPTVYYNNVNLGSDTYPNWATVLTINTGNGGIIDGFRYYGNATYAYSAGTAGSADSVSWSNVSGRPSGSDFWNYGSCTWNVSNNITCTASSGEFSIDVTDNSSGSADNVLWHVWSGNKENSMIQCYPKSGKVNVVYSLTVGGTAVSLDGHTHSYLPLSGGTLTGSLTFANGTYNVVGDDCAIGDINVAGTLGIKGQNGQTNIAFVNQSNSYYTRLIGQVVGSNRDVYLPSTAGTLCVASYASGTGTLTINT